jgi:hypothetical protein
MTAQQSRWSCIVLAPLHASDFAFMASEAAIDVLNCCGLKRRGWSGGDDAAVR